jgi:hypothetical protein
VPAELIKQLCTIKAYHKFVNHLEFFCHNIFQIKNKNQATWVGEEGAVAAAAVGRAAVGVGAAAAAARRSAL